MRRFSVPRMEIIRLYEDVIATSGCAAHHICPCNCPAVVCDFDPVTCVRFECAEYGDTDW